MANNIHPTAIIGDNVELGDNNIIGAYCIIGSMAEHRHCKHLGKVKIGNNNIITGLVTIDAGTEFTTTIGDGCYIMKHSYIAHDCIIHNNVTISAGVKIGGHCIINDNVNLGMNATIHQRVEIPTRCMIGASAFVGKKSILRPRYKYVGVPVKELGENI
jgi:UDP-N-acetylglucosamine acyltransferase